MRTFPSPSPAPPTAACRRRTACGSPQLVSTPRPRWPVLTRRRMAGFEVSIEGDLARYSRPPVMRCVATEPPAGGRTRSGQIPPLWGLSSVRAYRAQGGPPIRWTGCFCHSNAGGMAGHAHPTWNCSRRASGSSALRPGIISLRHPAQRLGFLDGRESKSCRACARAASPRPGRPRLPLDALR